MHQLRMSSAKCLFTCGAVLDVALAACEEVGIGREKVFIFDVPGSELPKGFKTVDDLIEIGRKEAELEALGWTTGQGGRQVAFLCFSSGTSGLPVCFLPSLSDGDGCACADSRQIQKAVMISHRNIIANMLQLRVYEDVGRKQLGVETQTGFALLPLSHAYGLHVVALAGIWRGDELIVLPKFEFTTYLKAIERFKVNSLQVVPPIVVRMLSSMDECRKYDLSSVRTLYVGAAPTGKETVDELRKHWPHWNICQGYGMTETATATVTTSEHDQMEGTSGSLLPGNRVKVMSFDGKEIHDYDTPGELWMQGPTTTLGYLNNVHATAEAFVWDEDGRWMRTGDEVIVTKSPKGFEHIAIVDRIKELIKVKVCLLLFLQTPPHSRS